MSPTSKYAPFTTASWLTGKPSRQRNGYSFRFNGQEGDNEIAGIGNIMTAEFWMYDGRLGRRWNVDPKPNLSISSYACLGNNPIMYSDPFGDTLFIRGTNGDNSLPFTDLAGMLAKENRNRIGIGQVPGRADPLFSNFITINTTNYQSGSDPAMDLLISLSGDNVDALYSTDNNPKAEATGGNPRTTLNSSMRVNISFNEGVAINSFSPKQGLGGDLSTHANGFFPPSKLQFDNMGNAISVGIDFQVAIDPKIKMFPSNSSKSKDIPRSMIAFQLLQSTFLLNVNSNQSGYNLKKAMMDANRIFINGNYRGFKGQSKLNTYPDVGNK